MFSFVLCYYIYSLVIRKITYEHIILERCTSVRFGAVMRIVCCDDDISIGKLMEEYLLEYFGQMNSALPEYEYFIDGESLLSYSERVDIAFLDIEMNGMNGIQVAKELKKRNSYVIIFIITSYIDYLDVAMGVHVFRYLLKPIDKNRLFRNMEEALFQYRTLSRKIQIETKSDTKVVYMNEIIFVEARGRKVLVYTKEGKYESIHTIQFWAEHLEKNVFFQTHRSYIVNMEYVSGYDHSLVYLNDGEHRAYLTQRKYKEFKKEFILYLKCLR